MIDITLDRDGDQPLYAQLRDAIALAVKEGRLRPGDRLPPVTALSKDLGVTQATVRRALEDLTHDGLVTSHVGRGTFVAEPAGSAAEAAPEADRSRSAPALPSPESREASMRLRAGVARSLEALMPLGRRPGLIRFNAGSPDLGLLPDDLLPDLVRQALESHPRDFLDYGDPLGLPALREALAERLSRSGHSVDPEQILVTSGSQQGIGILAQWALETRADVLCETPCYAGATKAFSLLGHWVEAVPRDEEGPSPERLARLGSLRSPLLYVCPLLHNPTGLDMSPARRKAVLEWLARRDGLLVADEVYRELHLDGPETPSFLGRVNDGRVALLGSLSKTVMPGLRVGWIVTGRNWSRRLPPFRQAMDLGGPPLMQGLALALLRSGQYDAHLDRAREAYRRRRDLLLSALADHMPQGVTWTTPQGGFNLWVRLPEGYSSIALFLAAIEHGVAIVPGPFLDIDHRFVNAFRLAYGAVPESDIPDGVARLAEAVTALLGHPPGDNGLSGLGNYP